MKYLLLLLPLTALAAPQQSLGPQIRPQVTQPTQVTQPDHKKHKCTPVVAIIFFTFTKAF